MTRWGIKSLENNPDYQDFIQNRRPALKKRDDALRRKFGARKGVNEVKTYSHAVTPDSEKTQQILTPAQQLEMRKNVAASASVEDALAVIDVYIFGDHTNGDADKITNVGPGRDRYRIDYTFTN